MKTSFKTGKALTNEYIKTVKSAEASNAQYLMALAKLVKSGKVSYNELATINGKLNSEAKETGIGTFKHVAMVVGRMYDKKSINGKSQAYQVDFKVVDAIIALGDKASMAKLKEIRKEGKEKQNHSAKVKTVSGKAETKTEAVKVDTKKEVQAIKDEVINHASELATKSVEELENQFFDLVAELEDIAQDYHASKEKKNTLATVNAYLQKALQML